MLCIIGEELPTDDDLINLSLGNVKEFVAC